jgi:hypothetical protein
MHCMHTYTWVSPCKYAHAHINGTYTGIRGDPAGLDVFIWWSLVGILYAHYFSKQALMHTDMYTYTYKYTRMQELEAVHAHTCMHIYIHAYAGVGRGAAGLHNFIWWNFVQVRHGHHSWSRETVWHTGCQAWDAHTNPPTGMHVHVYVCGRVYILLWNCMRQYKA